MDHAGGDQRHHQPQNVSLPSIDKLTQRLDHPQTSPSQHSASFDPARDSGNWSMQSQQSKHSSTVSSNANLHLHTILNSRDDDSSTRFSAGSNNGALPTLNQPLDPRDPSRSGVDATSTSFLNLDSRRSSIDSRMNVNMGHLAINNQPTSPYESTNASQQSLVSNLQQQRGIHATPIQPRANGGGPGLSPLSGRPSVPEMRPRTANPATPRRAPVIVNTNKLRERGMPDPMASEPTKGFAWAFPDKPDRDDMETSTSPQSSRHGSITASSINTMDSAYHNRSRGFSDADIHQQHALQHKSITNLQVNDAHMGSGNYSRTPELRVSHKLAERKRRSEMKDLFDSLNKILPNSPGNKSSKWEVLSKAIEYIDSLKIAYSASEKNVDRLRSEVNRAQAALEENHLLSNEITAMYQQLLRVDPNGHHVFGPRTQFLTSQESHTPHRLAPMQPGQQQSSQGPSSQSQNQPPSGQSQQGSWSQSQQPMQGVEYR